MKFLYINAPPPLSRPSLSLSKHGAPHCVVTNPQILRSISNIAFVFSNLSLELDILTSPSSSVQLRQETEWKWKIVDSNDATMKSTENECHSTTVTNAFFYRRWCNSRMSTHRIIMWSRRKFRMRRARFAIAGGLQMCWWIKFLNCSLSLVKHSPSAATPGPHLGHDLWQGEGHFKWEFIK